MIHSITWTDLFIFWNVLESVYQARNGNDTLEGVKSFLASVCKSSIPYPQAERENQAIAKLEQYIKLLLLIVLIVKEQSQYTSEYR